MKDFGTLLRFELVKARARRATWVPFVALAAMIGVFAALAQRLQLSFVLERFRFLGLSFASKEEFANGSFFAAHTMTPLFQLVVPVFVVLASGHALAGESESGTLRAYLARPVSRTGVVLAKGTLLLANAVCLSLFAMVLAAVLGRLLFGAGPLYSQAILFGGSELGVHFVAEPEVVGRLVAATCLASVSMLAFASFALMVSALVDSTAMASTVSLAVYFGALVLQKLPFGGGVLESLFVDDMLCWVACFQSSVPWDELGRSVASLGLHTCAFVVAAVLALRVRDVLR